MYMRNITRVDSTSRTDFLMSFNADLLLQCKPIVTIIQTFGNTKYKFRIMKYVILNFSSNWSTLAAPLKSNYQMNGLKEIKRCESTRSSRNALWLMTTCICKLPYRLHQKQTPKTIHQKHTPNAILLCILSSSREILPNPNFLK